MTGWTGMEAIRICSDFFSRSIPSFECHSIHPPVKNVHHSTVILNSPFTSHHLLSEKCGRPPPSAEGGGRPHFTLPSEISFGVIPVISESFRHSLVILSIRSVKCGRPHFTLLFEISSRAILVISESFRHSLVILSIRSVKCGHPPPSAEGGGRPHILKTQAR